MEFIVREMSNKPGTAYVRYDCECGCKPGAEYTRDSGEAGSDHCCCGNVHFVGSEARTRLDAYLVSRTDEDAELDGYKITETTVPAPWGGEISVAYALPNVPRAH
ncbi:MAG TPA: hypothetical protein VIT93_00275 [Dehalococcoidia bacterium]